MAIGFVVNTTPSVGAIAYWGKSATSSDGHVAYVEQVNGSGPPLISEYNEDFTGHYGERTVSAPSYIHIP